MKSILLFSADYCNPCKTVKAVLDSLDMIYAIIDTEYQTRTVEAYDIRSLPTLIVVDSDGNELHRLVGSRPKKEYAAVKKMIEE